MEETVSRPFPTLAEIEARFAALDPSPTDRGTVEMLVIRPDRGLRETPQTLELRGAAGAVGDSWYARAGKRPDGTPNPETQITVMSAGVLRCLADRERWPLAGDQLIVDLDIGEANLPAGSRIALGTAILEISPIPHTGCSKFRERFGLEAGDWVDAPERKALRLRGLLARVVKDGAVQVGDDVTVVHRPS